MRMNEDKTIDRLKAETLTAPLTMAPILMGAAIYTLVKWDIEEAISNASHPQRSK